MLPDKYRKISFSSPEKLSQGKGTQKLFSHDWYPSSEQLILSHLITKNIDCSCVNQAINNEEPGVAIFWLSQRSLTV